MLPVPAVVAAALQGALAAGVRLHHLLARLLVEAVGAQPRRVHGIDADVVPVRVGDDVLELGLRRSEGTARPSEKKITVFLPGTLLRPLTTARRPLELAKPCWSRSRASKLRIIPACTLATVWVRAADPAAAPMAPADEPCPAPAPTESLARSDAATVSMRLRRACRVVREGGVALARGLLEGRADQERLVREGLEGAQGQVDGEDPDEIAFHVALVQIGERGLVGRVPRIGPQPIEDEGDHLRPDVGFGGAGAGALAAAGAAAGALGVPLASRLTASAGARP